MDEMKTTENKEVVTTVQPKEKKKKPILLIALTVLVVALLAMNATFLALQMNSNKKLSQYIDDDRAYMLANQPVTGYQEDGYVVAGMYEIKSTKAISDAYKNNDTTGLDEKQLKTLEMASAVIDEVVKPEMSLFEKEKAIYEWMAKNIPHENGSAINVPNTDTAEAVSTPYGVLYGKRSVCVGYATTFRLFMEMIGTECHIVHNDGHSWDLVKMDDDTWYHVDVYMDAENTLYSNFNMTDTLAHWGHDWNDEGYLPAANKSTYCYASMNAVNVTAADAVVQTVFEAVNNPTPENKTFYFAYDPKNEQLTQEISSTFEILNSLFTQTELYPQFIGKSVYGYPISIDESTTVYYAQYNDENANTNPSTPENPVDYGEMMQRLQELINQTFGTDYIYYYNEEPVEYPIEGAKG